jgi:hypothetical protein
MEKAWKLPKRGYPTVSGEEVVRLKWRTADLKMACCDCSLVHRIRFTVKRGVLFISMQRDNRATAQLRRHRNSSK